MADNTIQSVGQGAAAGAAAGSVVPGLGTAVGGALGALGGLLGNLFAGGDQAAANQALANAQQVIQSVGAPPDLAQQIIFDQFQQVGLLTPQLQNAVQQTYSATANVQQNAQAAGAQQQALQQLQQVSQLGSTPQEQAALATARNNINANAAAQAGAINQNMQARGMANSGATLAAQLSNAQNASNNYSQQGLQIAGQANQNALSALSAAGNLAGNINQQTIGLNTTRAQAQDAMNRFNVQQQTAANQANVSAQNLAQQQNLATQQQTANANTAQSNAELLRETQAQGQDWTNQLGYAQAQANASTGAAQNLYNPNAQATRNLGGGIGAGLGQGAGGIYQYLNNSKNTNQNNQTTNKSDDYTDDDYMSDLGY